jgi:hypothetical protein
MMKIKTRNKSGWSHFKKFIQFVQKVATGGGSKEVVDVDIVFNSYWSTVLECAAGKFSFKMKMPGKISSLVMMQAGSIAGCSDVKASNVGEIADCQMVMTIVVMKSRMTNPGVRRRGSFKIERTMGSGEIVMNAPLTCSNWWSKARCGRIR